MSLSAEWIARARAVPIEDELARRGIKLRGKIERDGPCPKCGGTDRFSINTAKRVFNCRGCGAKGDVIALVEWLDNVDFIHATTTLAGEEPPKANGKANGKDHEPEAQKVKAAQYRYDDANGKLVFGVVRYEYQLSDGSFVLGADGKRKKTFSQCRLDPERPGKWIWNIDGVAVVPYRLPELIEAVASGYFVVIVEGEAKVDLLRSWNVPATCNAGGAKKWKPEHSEFLRGADVMILPDNDQAGRDHADLVGTSLQGIAARVRVLELPGLPTKGDIVDWAKQGGTREQLDDLIEHQAKKWTPPSKADADKGESNSSDEPVLRWLDMSGWDDEPRPQREWAILNRVPLRQAGLFSGEGGTGKSIIEMMKDVAHVTGKDWMGSLPEIGPAFYIGAEDDEKEIHIRFYDIAAHYGVTFNDLVTGGLHVLCKLGEDATLCAANGKSGKVETTDFYRQIYQAAGDIKPKNISIDTLSRAFAGNEIDRVQVYAFAMHMQALAMVAQGSVTVLSHPSLQGMSSGSGISGSTAWHGAFRFRQYLKGVKPDDGEQPDSNLRELEFKKNQYGPLGETIAVQYRNGLFLPIAGMSSLDKIAREAKTDEVFLDLLKRFTREGRNVSEKPTANGYAPTCFAKEAEAKKVLFRKDDLEAAMRRLFAVDKIHVESYGRPSRPASRLALKG